MAEKVKYKYGQVIQTMSDLIRATLYKQGLTEDAEKHARRMRQIYEGEQHEREEARKRAEEELKVSEIIYFTVIMWCTSYRK